MPALFPCKNALPACNRLGVARETSLRRVTPVGSSGKRKELSLRDVAAKAQRQQQRKKFLKPLVVSQLRRSTKKKKLVNLFEEVCSSSRNTITCCLVSRSELLLEADQWKVPEVPLLADGNFKVPEEVATSHHKLRERHSKARVPV